MCDLKATYKEGMTSDEIATCVLGKKSRRVPGLGFGPRPEDFKSQQGASKIKEEITEELHACKEQLKVQEEKLISQEELNKAQEERLEAQEERNKAQEIWLDFLNNVVAKLLKEREVT